MTEILLLLHEKKCLNVIMKIYIQRNKQNLSSQNAYAYVGFKWHYNVYKAIQKNPNSCEWNN